MLQGIETYLTVLKIVREGEKKTKIFLQGFGFLLIGKMKHRRSCKINPLQKFWAAKTLRRGKSKYMTCFSLILQIL